MLQANSDYMTIIKSTWVVGLEILRAGKCTFLGFGYLDVEEIFKLSVAQETIL